jgi:hypothetical protein
MAKMFYTQAEAATKLGKTPDDVKQLVRDGRLREFMDNGPVYRIEDIDKLSAPGGAAGTADAVDLELVEEPSGGSKEDTVITSAGISVFDDEDLQIEADPMAQTSITPSVEDQISLETPGSGSGLLDLTREADDTSLGAELLDEIYPSAPVETGELVSSQTGGSQVMDQGMSFAAPPMIEASDASAGAFVGVAFVGVLIAAFVAFLVASLARDTWPAFMSSVMNDNGPFVLGGVLAGLTAIFGVVGLVIGRSTAGPRA